jgi:hypothetical protein
MVTRLALLTLSVLSASPLNAQPAGVEEAIQKGARYLSARFANGAARGERENGIGETALAGLALLETGAKPNDPAIRVITAAVRDGAFTETKTYQLSLSLMYLDKLGDRADLPLIQMLAVRLLAGQNHNGGWGYSCIAAVPPADERRLRTGLLTAELATGRPLPKAEPGRAGVTGKLHPEVEAYARGLLDNRTRGDAWDDNSNTQFALLAVWVARRNGVPVEDALDRIDRRFVRSQHASGGWPYSGIVGGPGSPSMTCAGLLGLSTGVARREENRMMVAAARKPEPKPAPPPPPGADPFFNPPPRPAPAPPPPKEPPPDPATLPVKAALANLGATLAAEQRKGAQAFLRTSGHGNGDLYFLWSLQRVAVVYGLDTIGGVDWYTLGAQAILMQQDRDGSWRRGNYSVEVDTAFALLFLTRANVARDLTSFVMNTGMGTELRGTRALPGVDLGPPLPKVAAPAAPLAMPNARATTTPKPLPEPVPVLGESPATTLAKGLLRMPDSGWKAELERIRDAKGSDHTTALLEAVPKLEGERKKQARDALAARLTRMTADTLRNMLASEEAELRRAATLACAMKDDKTHVPDLIDRLTDSDEAVVRAARAGVKSLTGAKIDFGPEPGSTPAQRKVAAAAWRSWWDTQK